MQGEKRGRISLRNAVFKIMEKNSTISSVKGKSLKINGTENDHWRTTNQINFHEIWQPI